MAALKTKNKIDWHEIPVWLARRDKRLSQVIRHVGKLPVPENTGGFDSLARAIVGQQLSGKAAQTIFKRVATLCGGRPICPRSFLGVPAIDLTRAGLSGRKREFLGELASSLVKEELDFAELETLSDEEVIERLCAMKGVGRWTAEMHLIFGMNRLDVFPIGDAALRSAMCRVYEWRPDRFDAECQKVAKVWQPFRSVACRYLYAYGDLV